ncbi:unnamed protein product, partial [Polarella glacialis]
LASGPSVTKYGLGDGAASAVVELLAFYAARVGWLELGAPSWGQPPFRGEGPAATELARLEDRSWRRLEHAFSRNRMSSFQVCACAGQGYDLYFAIKDMAKRMWMHHPDFPDAITTFGQQAYHLAMAQSCPGPEVTADAMRNLFAHVGRTTCSAGDAVTNIAVAQGCIVQRQWHRAAEMMILAFALAVADPTSDCQALGHLQIQMALTIPMGACAFCMDGFPGEDHYVGRTPFRSAAVLLPNARVDAVRRLLHRTQQMRSEEEVEADDASSTTIQASPRMSPRTPRTPKVGSDCSPSSCRSRTPFARVRSDSPGVEPAAPSWFAFEKLLGKGAFGEVYQVTHKSTGVQYAMKILRKSKVLTGNLLRYTMTERNVLSYTRHPYIVELHYAFQTSSHLVLVLEFCPQGNLQHLIESERRLQEPLARLYAAEVLLALGHLHDRRVVFRDLKPENVVIDEEGHVKLTDFGLSKEGVTGPRGTQSFCGSLAFIAPEVLARKGHGHSVDLYGLGVLLFAMLTGMPPFYHPEKNALLVNIKTAKLRVPRGVSEEAKSLIESLMEREPMKRIGASRTTDVQSHVFFAEMDWAALMRREVTAPLPLLQKQGTSDFQLLCQQVGPGNRNHAVKAPMSNPFQV